METRHPGFINYQAHIRNLSSLLRVPSWPWWLMHYFFTSVASSVSSEPTVIVISFVQGLYPGFSTRKVCFPGLSAIFAGVYPMESPSTNTSERNGVERTTTKPVEGAGGGGGGGGAGSGAAALSSPDFEKPIIDCGAASRLDSRFF